MEINENSLENKSRKFVESRIKEDPENQGFNPREIENFYECAKEVDYLLKNKYLVEKQPAPGQEITVESVRYILTHAGRLWASN